MKKLLADPVKTSFTFDGLLGLTANRRSFELLLHLSAQPLTDDEKTYLAPLHDAWDPAVDGYNLICKDLRAAGIEWSHRGKLSEEERSTLPNYATYKEALTSFMKACGSGQKKIEGMVRAMHRPQPPLQLMVATYTMQPDSSLSERTRYWLLRKEDAEEFATQLYDHLYPASKKHSRQPSREEWNETHIFDLRAFLTQNLDKHSKQQKRAELRSTGLKTSFAELYAKQLEEQKHAAENKAAPQ